MPSPRPGGGVGVGRARARAAAPHASAAARRRDAGDARAVRRRLVRGEAAQNDADEVHVVRSSAASGGPGRLPPDRRRRRARRRRRRCVQSRARQPRRRAPASYAAATPSPPSGPSASAAATGWNRDAADRLRVFDAAPGVPEKRAAPENPPSQTLLTCATPASFTASTTSRIVSSLAATVERSIASATTSASVAHNRASAGVFGLARKIRAAPLGQDAITSALAPGGPKARTPRNRRAATDASAWFAALPSRANDTIRGRGGGPPKGRVRDARDAGEGGGGADPGVSAGGVLEHQPLERRQNPRGAAHALHLQALREHHANLGDVHALPDLRARGERRGSNARGEAKLRGERLGKRQDVRVVVLRSRRVYIPLLLRNKTPLAAEARRERGDGREDDVREKRRDALAHRRSRVEHEREQTRRATVRRPTRRVFLVGARRGFREEAPRRVAPLRGDGEKPERRLRDVRLWSHRPRIAQRLARQLGARGERRGHGDGGVQALVPASAHSWSAAETRAETPAADPHNTPTKSRTSAGENADATRAETFAGVGYASA